MKEFQYEGKDYTLGMTRAGVRAAEANGLLVSELQEKPFTAVYLLFFAALYSQYKLSPRKSDEMLDHLLDSGEATIEQTFETLAEMYAELFGSGESD